VSTDMERHEGFPSATDAVRCGPLWVSPHEMCELRIDGLRTPMSVRHIRILAMLLEAEGRILTREEIYKRSSRGLLPRGSRTVDVQVTRIRRTLGDLGRFIIAVPERGYRIDVLGLAKENGG
jgi:DNA-binding response OmpR family regulator